MYVRVRVTVYYSQCQKSVSMHSVCLCLLCQYVMCPLERVKCVRFEFVRVLCVRIKCVSCQSKGTVFNIQCVKVHPNL